MPSTSEDCHPPVVGLQQALNAEHGEWTRLEVLSPFSSCCRLLLPGVLCSAPEVRPLGLCACGEGAGRHKRVDTKGLTSIPAMLNTALPPQRPYSPSPLVRHSGLQVLRDHRYNAVRNIATMALNYS